MDHEPLIANTDSRQIKDQHSAYLRKELTALRDKHIPDTRIHCCLFFINPTGHTLKPVRPQPRPFFGQKLMIQIDIVVLKKLAEVVNVVPVIAKSDSLTLEERHLFKQRVSY
jgi:septin 3/9/12